MRSPTITTEWSVSSACAGSTGITQRASMMVSAGDAWRLMWVGYKKKPCRSRAFSELRSGLGFRLCFRFGFRFGFRFRRRHDRADHFHRDAAVRGQAFDQLLALHLVLAELGYGDRLFRAFAFPEDQFLVDAFAHDVVFDAESTF